MRRMQAIVCLALIFSATAVSQPSDPPRPKPRTVTVRGTGKISATPDQIRLSMQVTVRGESASMAMTTASQRTKEVLALLESNGVEAKDVQTSRVAVSAIYDYEKRVQPPPIVGYTASNDFSAVFRGNSMSKLGAFLDKAVEAGASNFGSLVYESSDQSGLERKALGEAALDAKKRADVLASGLGAGTGRVLSITETGMSVPSPVVQADYMRSESAMAAPVMTGELNIVANVDVVFELVEP